MPLPSFSDRNPCAVLCEQWLRSFKADCAPDSLYQGRSANASSNVAFEGNLSGLRNDENELSDSDVLDTQSELDTDYNKLTGAFLEADVYSAKRFLERNWGYTCDCKGGREENEAEHANWCEQQRYSLLDMTEQWRKIAVPDSIVYASPLILW
ncbi:Uncharacterized protein HZ326_15772 [Fusarium oxysporum f. sp. albedinis]|nr:Uncharacterized protein HZ326_15772 [Fusarium oxysporum f. sp. albedinis]